MNTRQRLVIAITLTLLILTTDQAVAQVAGGGGGGGLLQQIITWVATNILQGLLMMAVLFVGVALMFSRHSLAGVATIIVGAIVVSQYQTIAGFFNIAG